MTTQTKKSKKQFRFDELKNEASMYLSSWKDLSRYINQKLGQFDDSRTSRGQMIDHKTILDGHATRAAEILASGLSSGMTNKSQDWVKPVVEDEEIAALPHVKEWLDTLQRVLLSICEGSNIYGVFNQTYKHLGIFGTGCYIILEDYEEVIRARSFTIGEYYLGTDSKGRVNTFGRKFQMTVEQLVEEFGLESCSAVVKGHWANNQRGVWIQVYHLIEPNKGRQPGKEDYTNMAYSSCYWEAGNGEEFLATRGYKTFRVVAPRWETATTDQIWGYGPGWYLLGDCKQLQKTTLDKLLAQEKIHTPPMQEDGSVTEGSSNYLPGGITRTSSSVPNAGVRPAYQINPDLESFIELVSGLKDAIDRYFYVNLFLMLMNVDKTQMTATEVAERQQEKVMMMGPILHKLDEEMLTPTLEIIYEIAMEAGMIPEPPQELQGMKIKLQYISILAQAQRSVGVSGIRSTLTLAGEVVAATADPAVMSVFKMDEIFREVGGMEGMPAKLLKTPEEMQVENEAKAQAQQAMQASEVANQAADTTKKLADAPVGTGSALDGLLKGQPK